MSDIPLPDPKARLELQGQSSEEVAAAVRAQREAKKAEKEARKLASLAKKKGGGGGGGGNNDAASGGSPAAAAAPVPAAAVAPQMAAHPQPALDPVGPTRRQRGVSEVFAGAAASTAATTTTATPSPGLRPDAPGGAPPSVLPTMPPSSAPSSAPAAAAPLDVPEPLVDAPWLPFPPGAPPSLLVGIHSRIAELGVLYHSLRIVGGNARTIALIDALRDVCASMPQLSGASSIAGLERELDAFVKKQIDYLALCREPCAGMTYVAQSFSKRLFAASAANANSDAGRCSEKSNSVEGGVAPSASAFSLRSTRAAAAAPEPLRHPSSFLASSSAVSVAATARELVAGFLDDIREEIFTAIHAIVDDRGPQQLRDGDRILVLGRSSAIELILKQAASRKIKFSVVVLDGAPLFEGRGFAWRLQQHRIDVSYGLLTSVCVHMASATRVFIGASAVLNSGDVLSRSGTATVACAAKQFRKPVICFCESYKFANKVWLGSLTVNEDTRGVFARSAMMGGSQASTDITPGDDNSPLAAAGAATPAASSRATPGSSAALPPATTASGAASATTAAAMVTGVAAGPSNDHDGRAALASLPAAVPVCVRDTVGRDGYLYDLTPAALVDMVVCEMGPLHPSAVSSAIRDREEREAQ